MVDAREAVRSVGMLFLARHIHVSFLASFTCPRASMRSDNSVRCMQPSDLRAYFGGEKEREKQRNWDGEREREGEGVSVKGEKWSGEARRGKVR